jgi:hypothetical protein
MELDLWVPEFKLGFEYQGATSSIERFFDLFRRAPLPQLALPRICRGLQRQRRFEAEEV